MLLVFALGACQGVSVRPETADASSIRGGELTGEEQRLLAAHVDRAITAVVRRRYEEADLAAGAALQIDPRCARARAVRGIVLYQRAARVEPPDLFLVHSAEAELLLALQIEPADAFVGWMHAFFLAESGHTSAAAAAAEAAIERATAAPPTERAALLHSAGTYRYELGEERAALPHLQAYVSLRPDDAAACFRIGNSLLRIASVPLGPTRMVALREARTRALDAARAFGRCAELAPGDEDAALAVVAATVRAAELADEAGEADVGQRLTSEAEELARAAASRFPTNAEAMFRVGVIAERRTALEAAGEAYSQALLRDPRHLGSLLNLAALSERAAVVGAPAALELLQRALRVDAADGGLTASERRRIEARLRGE